MNSIVVFDLDGTLALDTHRARHLEKDGDKDWDAYYAACSNDLPNRPIIDLYQRLCRDGQNVEIWTGRVDRLESVTKSWLLLHATFLPARLRMRSTYDRTQDYDLKKQWLRETQRDGGEVRLVFEDRKRVVEMWRAQGIVCCHVAPGDF